MTSQLNVDTIANKAGSGTVGLFKQSASKAWGNYDYDGTQAFADSFNFASITDRATGCMYGNFTNNMNTVNYTVMASSSPVASGSMATDNNNRSCIASADTTARSSINVFNTDTVSSYADEENQQSVVHGDLA